jgi:hypothetical protein
MLLIDVAFIELRPTPWRQAVDLANMMLCLALRSSPELVYERALRLFSVQEISEGFAAARGLAMPSQLRRMLRAQGRDLHAQFVRLLPAPPQPIPIQRWSPRRIGLLAGVSYCWWCSSTSAPCRSTSGRRLSPRRRVSATWPAPIWSRNG